MSNKNIILIGDSASKRAEFFTKAAHCQNVDVTIIEWEEIFKLNNYKDFFESRLEGAVVKIEPPSFKLVDLSLMDFQLKKYIHIMEILEECNAVFLNTPKSILNALDKRYTKKILSENKVEVTQMLFDNVHSAEQLFDMMKKANVYQVFIKPVYFSGAAGVSAFRINPKNGDMRLYTSCYMENGRLFNTKKMHQFANRKEISDFLDKLISLDVIVEKWHPKARINNLIYDLRVVYQFGRIEYIVVRTAKGPVTNLHLNNMAIPYEKLGFSENKYNEIDRLCNSAIKLFDGMQMAGIDIMLDSNSLKPRIIEINGQGDLIYQDIYAENKIYEQQVKKCEKMF